MACGEEQAAAQKGRGMSSGCIVDSKIQKKTTTCLCTINTRCCRLHPSRHDPLLVLRIGSPLALKQAENLIRHGLVEQHLQGASDEAEPRDPEVVLDPEGVPMAEPLIASVGFPGGDLSSIGLRPETARQNNAPDNQSNPNLAQPTGPPKPLAPTRSYEGESQSTAATDLVLPTE